MSPKEHRRARLEKDIAWLEARLADVQRDKQRVPYIAVLAILAIPAWMVAGFGAALGLLACVAMLMGIGFYIVGGHTADYRGRLDAARRELDELADATLPRE